MDETANIALRRLEGARLLLINQILSADSSEAVTDDILRKIIVDPQTLPGRYEIRQQLADFYLRPELLRYPLIAKCEAIPHQPGRSNYFVTIKEATNDLELKI